VIEKLPFVNEPGFQHAVSFSIGKNIYTPEDLERTDLIQDDRPYAGITYLAIGFHSKNSHRMDSLELDLGIVGPHSYAEQCQKAIHDWIYSTDPKGWDNQLKDEPVLNIFYGRKWKLMQSGVGHGFGYDVIPHMGCALGNAATFANAGAQIRFGWNLPNDFGTFLIRPGCDSNAPSDKQDPRFFPRYHQVGIHLFAGVDGHVVLRNIFLDGNTFRDSHSVDKEHFVVDLVGGAGMIIYRFKITYTYVYKTKEYKTQKDEQKYGAITLSYSF
jgi:lipid A 3-O-deacylase